MEGDGHVQDLRMLGEETRKEDREEDREEGKEVTDLQRRGRLFFALLGLGRTG
jgi:hypothetical protein